MMHNLDVIKTGDYIIDMGPEGGFRGGTVVTTGTPEEVACCKESHTGFYIKEMLDRQAQGLPGLGFAAEAGSV